MSQTPPIFPLPAAPDDPLPPTTIGIVQPPPDIRSIVDKVSEFVAKKGPEFEKRFFASNAGNVRFSFLDASDPYHAYYQHRLSEFPALDSSPLSPSPSPDSSLHR